MKDDLNRDSNSAFQHAVQVKDRYEQALLGKGNVIGVGVGIRRREGVYTGEVALIVMVSKKLPRVEVPPEDLLPDEIEGVPVDIQEVGEIDAQ
jgi:hypothetical protein